MRRTCVQFPYKDVPPPPPQQQWIGGVLKPRSMADPDYVRRPLSDEQRAKLSRAQRKRLGIPEGYARVYGFNVPEKVAADVRAVAQEVIRRSNREAAAATIREIRRRGWKIPAREGQRKSVGVSSAYDCIDTALPVVFRG